MTQFFFDDDILALADEVVRAAVSRGVRVTTAESCTGGLVSGAITAVPGSSSVLDFGFVTYSNGAKTALVGVPEDLLETHGAVSEAVARAMAEGAARASGADAAVAITGVAGPGGGTADKPVGLVHFAATGPGGTIHLERRYGDIGRDVVRRRSLIDALTLLLDRITA